jgi:hypothetical protein
MPLTTKGKKILRAMRKEYGTEKGTRVFYASINSGLVTGAERGAKDEEEGEVKKTRVKRNGRSYTVDVIRKSKDGRLEERKIVMHEKPHRERIEARS